MSEWINSRKISTKSLQRHFSIWKKRVFTVEGYYLSILGENSSRYVKIPLKYLDVKRHHYAGDDGYCVSLKCSNHNEPTYDVEYILKFRSQIELEEWEKAIIAAIHEERSRVQVIEIEAMKALGHFFKERMKLQSSQGEVSADKNYGEYSVSSTEKQDSDWYLWKSNENSSNDNSANNLQSRDSLVDSNTSNKSTLTRTNSKMNQLSALDISHVNQIISSKTNEKAVSRQRKLRKMPWMKNFHANVMLEARPSVEIDNCYWRVPLPRLRILLMVVGTRGDVQPFAQLGKRLQKDGHRVRLATHECFRDFVLKNGLEFYPLGGDPQKLSEYMVRTHGFIIPPIGDLVKVVPENLAMLSEIIHSCWGACVERDPKSPQQKPFVADAIISNPVTYGHIHCAEALGVPLHLMFPQPWLPTKAFPHPMSSLSYQNVWSTENFLSYQMVDHMLWLSLKHVINNFRQSVLGLKPIRIGEGGWNILTSYKIPFAKMWSPALVPKPKDWPDYVDIVGTFFEAPLRTKDIDVGLALTVNSATSSQSPGATGKIKANTGTTYSKLEENTDIKKKKKTTSRSNSNPPPFTPSNELSQFLDQGPAPVYVGFGSMIIADPESLIKSFLEASALAGVRVIIQTGWSEISQDKFRSLSLEAERKAMLIAQADEDHGGMVGNTSEDHLHDSMSFSSTQSSLKTDRSTDPDEFEMVDDDESFSEYSSGASKPMSEHRSDATPTVNNIVGTWFSGSADAISLGFGTLCTLTAPNFPKSHSISDTNSSPSHWRRGSSSISKTPADIRSLSSRDSSDKGLSKNRHSSSNSKRNLHNSNKEGESSGKTVSSRGSNHLDQDQDTSELNSSNGNTSNIHDKLHRPWKADLDAILIGPCPHSWLFEQVAAVVHHGGAGTTAIGLRLAKPTWICPFFGDQNFWGEMVHRRGLGPRPCPVQQLTLETIAESLETLFNADIRQRVRELSLVLEVEDGVEGAIDSFYRRLPIDRMLCDVSLFMGESKLAQVYCHDCRFKMCTEVSQRVHRGTLLNHRVTPCCYVDWSMHGPQNAADGLLQGLGVFVDQVTEGVTDIFYQPVRGIYEDGISGVATGMVNGIFRGFLSKSIEGGTDLLTKVGVGFKTGFNRIVEDDSSLDPLKRKIEYDPPEILKNGSVSTRGAPRGVHHRSSMPSEGFDEDEFESDASRDPTPRVEILTTTLNEQNNTSRNPQSLSPNESKDLATFHNILRPYPSEGISSSSSPTTLSAPLLSSLSHSSMPSFTLLRGADSVLLARCTDLYEAADDEKHSSPSDSSRSGEASRTNFADNAISHSGNSHHQEYLSDSDDSDSVRSDESIEAVTNDAPFLLYQSSSNIPMALSSVGFASPRWEQILGRVSGNSSNSNSNSCVNGACPTNDIDNPPCESGLSSISPSNTNESTTDNCEAKEAFPIASDVSLGEKLTNELPDNADANISISAPISSSSEPLSSLSSQSFPYQASHLRLERPEDLETAQAARQAASYLLEHLDNDQSIDATPKDVSTTNDWLLRDEEVHYAYEQAKSMQAIIRSINNSSSRCLTLANFKKMLEKAKNNSDLETVQLIVEMLSRKKPHVDFVDISLFHLESQQHGKLWKHAPSQRLNTLLDDIIGCESNSNHIPNAANESQCDSNSKNDKQ